MKSDHRDRNYLFTLRVDNLPEQADVIDAVNFSNELRFPNHPYKKGKENCFAESRSFLTGNELHQTDASCTFSFVRQWNEENWDFCIE